MQTAPRGGAAGRLKWTGSARGDEKRRGRKRRARRGGDARGGKERGSRVKIRGGEISVSELKEGDVKQAGRHSGGFSLVSLSGFRLKRC